MSIQISIGKKWLITSNDQQVILNKKNEINSGNGGSEKLLEKIGSFRTIDELVNELIHLEVYSSDVVSLQMLANEIKRASKMCYAAFTVDP